MIKRQLGRDARNAVKGLRKHPRYSGLPFDVFVSKVADIVYPGINVDLEDMSRQVAEALAENTDHVVEDSGGY